MKSIKTLSLIVATSVLVASCTSYNQAAAGVTGAALGSHIGRDIGWLTSGHHFGGRNAALGSLIGAGVGAALGVGIQNSIENSRANRANRAAEREYQRSQDSYSSDDYQTGGGAYDYDRATVNGNTSYNRPATSSKYVSVEALTYMDGDGDGYISKGETIEVETYITNISNNRLRGVRISLNVPEDKYVTISSPLIIDLNPGQKVKYTGRIYCQKVKTDYPVNVSVNVNAEGLVTSTGVLNVYMK